MRKLAAALLVVFTCLAAVDGIVCPDGCTDDAPKSGQAAHPGSCLACLNGVALTATVIPLTSLMPLTSEPPPVVLKFTVCPSHDIDHPPRFSA